MSTARPAVTVLGKDFTFPNRIDGMPEKLSDFADLKIGFFDTTRRRQTRLLGGRFRRATQALPRVRARPAQPGLSQYVDHGCRISRFSADLKEFVAHVGVDSAHF